MVATTLEMGPAVGLDAPDFSLINHENHQVTLHDIMGARGVLLGFTGDIWQPASVRRILWLQRQHNHFAHLGVEIALLICDKPQMLFGYSMGSVRPLQFPLLADADRHIHEAYRMTRYAGLVLVDSNYIIRDKWIVPDERVWPRAAELYAVFDNL